MKYCVGFDIVIHVEIRKSEQIKETEMIIKEIKIRNFRSIVNQTIKIDQMNVFVGNNDVGKSNVLKALNLFFNSETEAGEPYNFDNDFTYLYSKQSKRAKEISIALTIQVPDTFKDTGLIVWEKVWNVEGQITTREKVFRQEDGASLPARSRVFTGLGRIKYRYVPAVRSKSYFKELLGTLYEAISTTLSKPLAKPLEDLSDALKQATLSMSDDLKNSLGINSTISMPDNLREFFTTLKFNTSLDNTGITYSLSQRGDGVQSRHIPMILKYIAEQDRLSRGTGAVRVFTIWGYEEPENSLELSKTFEMAEEIFHISNDIQTLVTTHSAAFYMISKREGVQLFSVVQKELDKETYIQPIINMEKIHEELGVMQLVSPFIEEVAKSKDITIDDLNRILKVIKKQNAELRRIVDETGIIDKPTIFVEGKTDKKYLIRAIEIHNKQLKQMINKGLVRIIAHDEFGGVVQVRHWIEAWCRTTNQSKMMALFDNDKASKKIVNDVKLDEIVQKRMADNKVKILFISRNDQIVQLLKKGVLFDYSIEHLFPLRIWRTYISLLETRSATMLHELNPELCDRNKSYNQLIDEIIEDEDIKELFINKCISCYKKDKFCERVLWDSVTDESIFDDFRPIVDAIANYFEVDQSKEEDYIQQVG